MYPGFLLFSFFHVNIKITLREGFKVIRSNNKFAFIYLFFFFFHFFIFEKYVFFIFIFHVISKQSFTALHIELKDFLG